MYVLFNVCLKTTEDKRFSVSSQAHHAITGEGRKGGFNPESRIPGQKKALIPEFPVLIGKGCIRKTPIPDRKMHHFPYSVRSRSIFAIFL